MSMFFMNRIYKVLIIDNIEMISHLKKKNLMEATWTIIPHTVVTCSEHYYDNFNMCLYFLSPFQSDIIPCLTPCLLDNADKVLREIELGPNSQGIYKCGRWMSEKVSQVHDMQGAYRLFESFRNSQELCR